MVAEEILILPGEDSNTDRLFPGLVARNHHVRCPMHGIELSKRSVITSARRSERRRGQSVDARTAGDVEPVENKPPVLFSGFDQHAWWMVSA
jgi:hypothetical protein